MRVLENLMIAAAVVPAGLVIVAAILALIGDRRIERTRHIHGALR